MVRMRNLLRRLHLVGGGGGSTDRRTTAAAPLIPSVPPPPSSSSRDGGSGLGVGVSESPSSSTSSPSPSTRGRSRSEGVAPGDFSLFEEEYQVQLALAISVSDPDGREDPESAQINAAKKMSLGCTPVGPTGRDGLADALSQRYWTYNVLNYNEKVIDGFYDLYGTIADCNLQGTIPLLVDLKAAPISDNIDHEVVLVNRADDEALRQLESQAVTISLQCKVAEHGPVAGGLIQMIADLVVDRMGGPVDDADDMFRRWSLKSYELRASLNTIVHPLGCLMVGLSRHRALLFKVLADRIDLPCRLVKGSCYTGIDDGAVILIKADDEREFIIDLMGAPGALIPAEIPTCYFQNAPIDVVNSRGITQNVKELSLALGSATNWQFDWQKEQSHGNSIGSSTQKESTASSKEDDSVARGRKHSDTLPCAINNYRDNEAESSFREIKAKTVPEYIASAAKNPDFAQKLHAILKESGLSPPSDLLTDLNLSHTIRDRKTINHEVREEQLRQNLRDDLNLDKDIYPVAITREKGWVLFDNGMSEMQYLKDPDSSCGAVQVSCGDKRRCPVYSGNAEGMDAMPDDTMQTPCLDSEDNPGIEVMEVNLYKQEPRKGYEESSSGHKGTADNNTASSNPVLDDVAEWEIPWEDLQLGERIGLGSYGEVYHADWNGTEVAVKKFLDQGLSDDSLEQFRAEVKIMLRLRHPNVVLFMGAVTRPPNLSILTEYLPRGSLFRLLHRPNPQIDEWQRLRMALDVAKGMNYLHTSHPPIVHRDLKSSNLLVDNSWVVKVCDFGLSRLKHHTFLSSKSTAGTPEWMAPEVLRNEQSNEKCDVYSFGVILWELATLRTPWSSMNPMQVVGAVGFQNRHLDIPNDVDPMVAEIIHNCWHSEPDKRPSFAQLLGPLKRLQRLVVQSD